MEIAALWNRMIRDTLSTFTTLEKSPADIEEMIEARAGAVLIALQQDEFAGFATYGPFRAGPDYAATVEHTILVSPQHQGAGVGRHLLEALQANARAQGVHVMVAGISHTNIAAQKFHRKMGYDEVGRMAQVGFKNAQWLDLVLMQKIL
ncbi:L-methionine sulfoximine/L-methionine sulfone acetyltransferase [Roseobacter fucihabitans]|uniref:L-methionine sulfoximine/L-methionine sulfone acetyltransferase n=1 Tax=Roseobacter fucihabitans TaxID=1537242 RepID=A0ABZ2BUU8_9RHOB